MYKKTLRLNKNILDHKSHRIYITGSRGFIASNLIRCLDTLNRNYTVIPRSSKTKLNLLEDEHNILLWAGEPSNIGLVNSSPYSEQIQLNQRYKRFLENDFDQIIYLSSISVYKRILSSSSYSEDDQVLGSNNYTKGKIYREKLTLSHEKGCVFRLSNVYGLGMKGNIFEDIKAQINNQNQQFLIRNVNSIMDLIYIDDLVSCINKSTEIGLTGLYNLSTNKITTPLDIIKFLFKELNIKKEIIETDPSGLSNLVGNNSKIRNFLNWKPEYEVYDGLRNLIKEGYF